MKMNTIIVTIVLFALMTTIVFSADTEQSKEKHQRTANKFAYILNEQWGIDQDKVLGETLFLKEFGADSLDIIELVMALEDYFDISIGDEDWERVTTVDSAVDLIIDLQEGSYRYSF